MKRLVAWLISGVVLAGLLITLLIPPRLTQPIVATKPTTKSPSEPARWT